jgi:1D-myo-inositol 3-kinase
MDDPERASELDMLIIGPATRDLLPEGGWRLGGTALYAALAASRLGLRAGVVTRGPAEVVEALRAAVPGALISAQVSGEATTFENVYDADGSRRQYLRGRSDMLTAVDVPAAWQRTNHVLLAPLAWDVEPTIVEVFPRQARIAATPQGWLRRWDETGCVVSDTWADAAAVLPRIEALIVSEEDLASGDIVRARVALAPDERTDWLERDPQLTAWRAAGTLVVVTQGGRGATLFTASGYERFAAFAVPAVDPTGAGDVFAVALLRAWWWGEELGAAMRFANAAAAYVVERPGTAGIPTRGEVMTRLRGATDRT